MATLPPNPHPFTVNDSRLPDQGDPFRHATPRTTVTTQDLELIMAAQQVARQTSAKVLHTRQRKIVGRATQARVPTCTHMTMDRLYGYYPCHMCGIVPELGWVYSCQQDRLLQPKHSVPYVEALPAVSDDDNYFEAQAKVAEALGMSKSVTSQMRRGEYNFDQIEILLQQRSHVLEIIRRAEHGSTRSTPSISPAIPQAQLPAENVIASVGTIATPMVQKVDATSLPMSPAGTPANTPAESTATTPVKQATKPKNMTCKYQVCHACRPFLQDRLPMSFDLVLNNEVPAMTEVETKKLPLLNPNVVRNLGLREPPDLTFQKRRLDIHDQQLSWADGQEEDDSEWTPTTTSSAFYSDEPETGAELNPCTGPAFCPLAPLDGMCRYDSGFDDGNRDFYHAIIPRHTSNTPAHGCHSLDMLTSPVAGSRSTSSTNSSISLPEPKSEPLTPTSPQGLGLNLALTDKLYPNSGKAYPLTGVLTDESVQHIPPRSTSRHSSSSSSVGSEIEVDGGVALTEEAVESGMPDIATSVQDNE